MSNEIRRPNHLRFVITGALVGFVIGGFLGYYRGLESTSVTAQGTYSTSTSMGYLALLGAMVFGLLAGAISVVIESVSERRNR